MSSRSIESVWNKYTPSFVADLPEEGTSDEDIIDWERSATPRIMLVLVSLILLKSGLLTWSALPPGSAFAAGAVAIQYGVAIQLMLFAATGLDLKRWGRVIAWVVLFAAAVAVLAAVARNTWAALGTDAMVFSAYASDFVLSGQNPYVVGMEDAGAQVGANLRFATPKIDGTFVASFSYPAGAFLAFVPAQIVGIQIRYTAVLTTILVGALVIYDSPPELALAGVATLFGGRNQLIMSAGGLFDTFWVLPVLVSMRFWYQGRWLPAGIAFGVAASMKQFPWMMGPFLVAWLLLEADTKADALNRSVRVWGGAAAAFALFNLPFIVDAPMAWVRGVITPLAAGAPLVHQGTGITVFTTTGVLPLSTTWHALAIVSAVVWSLVGYVLYFDRVKWVAWVVPMLFLFVHYRSLNSYWVAFSPIVVYAVYCEFDRLEGVSRRSTPRGETA